MKILLATRGNTEGHDDTGDSINDIINELEGALKDIVGMEKLKKQLEQYATNLLADNARRTLGMTVVIKRPVMAFIGNPGTGKTSVAKIVASHTAEKTNLAIDNARGGTMLIDEAYQLTPIDGGRDFGPEAVETIMGTIEGGMSTSDDRPAYIFAGYSDDMSRFLNINPGLKRRITDVFLFNDYNVTELSEIFVKMCERESFVLKVPLDVIEQGISRFPSNIVKKHNAGICLQIVQASKCNLNARAVKRMKMGVKISDMGDDLACILTEDFLHGCETIITKLEINV